MTAGESTGALLTDHGNAKLGRMGWRVDNEVVAELLWSDDGRELHVTSLQSRKERQGYASALVSAFIWEMRGRLVYLSEIQPAAILLLRRLGISIEGQSVRLRISRSGAVGAIS